MTIRDTNPEHLRNMARCLAAAALLGAASAGTCAGPSVYTSAFDTKKIDGTPLSMAALAVRGERRRCLAHVGRARSPPPAPPPPARLPQGNVTLFTNVASF